MSEPVAPDAWVVYDYNHGPYAISLHATAEAATKATAGGGFGRIAPWYFGTEFNEAIRAWEAAARAVLPASVTRILSIQFLDPGNALDIDSPVDGGEREREEREDLAEIICPCGHGVQLHSWSGCSAWVRGSSSCCTRTPTGVVLASDWLAQVKATARAEAWDEGEQAGRGNADRRLPRSALVENPYRTDAIDRAL
jgi:hypothetical protein